jgi:oxygen-independent coproporphyrinogen III oxidase
MTALECKIHLAQTSSVSADAEYLFFTAEAQRRKENAARRPRCSLRLCASAVKNRYSERSTRSAPPPTFPGSTTPVALLGMYVHIPFCVKKCGYCDFTSYGDKFQFVHHYLDALEQEIAFYAQRGVFTRYTPATFYVGGGTPSLLSEGLVHLIAAHRHVLHWDALAETTIEVNPGAVTADQLRALRRVGFNRLSIGIQSFQAAELRALDRIHSPDEAVACFRQARAAGFQNINLDLMFGIPDSTLPSWEASLRHALALEPEHIAIYNLTIEAGTPFEARQQRGQLRLPDEDAQVAMYELGLRCLAEAGYEHYEISNFARPGRRSQHNQIYWRNAEYLGLGAAAHSYLEGRRYWNTPDVVTYIVNSMAAGAESASSPATISGEERLDGRGRMGETIMLGLRMREGVNLDAFAARFGMRLEHAYANALEALRQDELLEIADGHLRLSQRGLYVANTVFQEFL